MRIRIFWVLRVATDGGLAHKINLLALNLKNFDYKLYKALTNNNLNLTFNETEWIFKDKFASQSRNRKLRN